MSVIFDWAANPLKLAASERALVARKQIDPSVIVDEESIKAEYIKRAGLVLEVEQIKAKKVEKAKRAE